MVTPTAYGGTGKRDIHVSQGMRNNIVIYYSYLTNISYAW